MKIKDRIKELRRVRAADLLPNPKNYRTHSNAQRDVLRGILADIGFADALLARETADGKLMLIDGHLRAKTSRAALVPVLVLDITPTEADKLLLTLDPLAAMAGTDKQKLAELVDRVTTTNTNLADFYDTLKAGAGLDHAGSAPDLAVPQVHQVVAECADPAQQELAFTTLTALNIPCRVLTL